MTAQDTPGAGDNTATDPPAVGPPQDEADSGLLAQVASADDIPDELLQVVAAVLSFLADSDADAGTG